jgi:CBS domain containing-hemolysin-like protein
MMDATIINWFAFGLCLLVAFLLSGMEAGVFALNRLRVRRLARAGKPSARVLNRFLEQPEKFLWTILVGNTLANFFIFGWILAKLHEWLLGEPWVIAAAFAVLVFVFYAFFDLLPKMIFRAHPNSMCLSVARTFRIINFVLRPLVSIVESVSQMILRVSGGQTFTGRLFGNREELRAVMQESSRSLTDDERTMVNRILDLQNFTVGQIAKPLAEMVSVEARTPLREAIARAREKNVSRLPVWEMRDGKHRVAGLLNIGTLLYRENLELEIPVSNYMIPGVFIHEGVRLEVALRLMQRAGQRIGIVLSPDRNEVGIVALKDILKVMFGEMNL